MINIEKKLETCGRFNLIVRKAETDEIVRETGWFDNLVLDQGLNTMATTAWFESCKVGTGNSTPVVTQTQLDAFVAFSSTVQTSQNGATATTPYYKWQRKTFRFNAGLFNNTNLTEVAIGYNTTANGAGIWNRALIKDGSGNPAVLTVLNDEVLDVVCEVRAYQSENDISGTFNLLDKSGNVIQTINTVIRPSKLTTAKTSIGPSLKTTNANYFNFMYAYSGEIGTNTGIPSGSVVHTATDSQGKFSANAYVSGSYQLVFTALYALGDGNADATKSLFLQGMLADYQVSLTPAIAKNASQTLTIKYTLTWGRYTP